MFICFCLLLPRPLGSTRTTPLFPCPPLFRSAKRRTPPSSFAISPMKGQTFIRQRLPGPSELAFPGSGSNHMTPLFSSRPVDGDTTRDPKDDSRVWVRSEEHTTDLQSLMRS